MVVLAGGMVACVLWLPGRMLKATSPDAALMAGFEGHVAVEEDPAALARMALASPRLEESLEEMCEYVHQSEPGVNVCPDGMRPLAEPECRDMPFFYGGAYGGRVGHPPATQEAPDLTGCYFFGGEYRFSSALEGTEHAEHIMYCKHCEIVSLDEIADWTSWNPGTAPKVSSRYRRISVGTCEAVGWEPVSSEVACQDAARELGLGWEDGEALAEVHEVQITTVAERPEGCYQFADYKEKTETTWFNVNPYSKGFGAETSEPRAGLLRQPVCQRSMTGGTDAWSEFYPELADLGSAEEEEQTNAVTTTMPPQRFRRLLTGNCTVAGGKPVASAGVCESAAKDLSLPNFTAAVRPRPDRPEGCYLERNREDTTATLWFNSDPEAVGRGAEASEGGKVRSPICEML